MPARIVVLGPSQVHLDAPSDAIPHEPEGGGLAGIEALLASAPEAAVVTGAGEACFFRASLAMERGVARVVLRLGALDDAWNEDLASRAERLGSSLFLRGDDNRYQRVRPKRGARAIEVGAPDVEAWASAIEAARGDTERTAELGLIVDPALRRALSAATPLPVDPAVPPLPDRLEDVAFRAGLKPVLYVVTPARELETLRQKYADCAIATRETVLSVDATTGRRAYDEGDQTAHAFVSRDAAQADRAAALWADGSSRNVRELGALMGYPDCCVTAFAALASRSNNAALTYVTASRTRALGAKALSPLNFIVQRTVPFTPCSFGCERAEAWALGVLGALPEATKSALLLAIERPVLYLDEARAVVFEPAPEPSNEGVAFAKAYWVAGAHPASEPAMLAARRLFAGAFEGGGVVSVDRDAFVIRRGRRPTIVLGRAPFGLGALIDFSAV